MAKKLKNYINGEWVESFSAEVNDLINPATGELLGHVPMSTAQETNTAIEAAAAAYPEWRNTPPVARSRYLHRLIPILEEKFQRAEHGSDQGTWKNH